jgi:hypothetical protein
MTVPTEFTSVANLAKPSLKKSSARYWWFAQNHQPANVFARDLIWLTFAHGINPTG